MVASASSRTTPPPSKMPAQTSPRNVPISRGATARSAVAPKVNASLNGLSRRSSTKVTPPTPRDLADDTRDALEAALKRETEEKEELLLRLQNKEQSLTDIKVENDSLSTALNSAESRLQELYVDQARVEDELSTRLELVDRLRAQIHELERDNRDVLRRYNEQTSIFDAERQSFYDNEQHLKSRIQTLVQTRKSAESESLHSKPSLLDMAEESRSLKSSDSNENHTTSQANARERLMAIDTDKDLTPTVSPTTPYESEDFEPPEMTALRLELSTLSTSHSSLQNTVQLLSAQLLDLQRVNNQLQEENESYNILLRERTLNGQFDILRSVGSKDNDIVESDEDIDEDDSERIDQRSLRSTDRNTLEPVDEVGEETDPLNLTNDDDQELSDDEQSGSLPISRDRSRRVGRGGSRRSATASRSPSFKGESLANLPITGPGLDLAAELGRAENQAILDGNLDAMDTRYAATSNKPKKASREAGSKNETGSKNEVDALKNEVKSLRDANKALSLYASKIIDRIIAQEGFEHVLAADYDKGSPSSPVKSRQGPKPSLSNESPIKRKARPQSTIIPAASHLSSDDTFNDNPAVTSPKLPSEQVPTKKAQRRSMSFDWKSFSLFGSTEPKPEPNPNLRPLNLRPGAASVVGRKLDTEEDEEDRKERERMNATLKLMGIEKPEVPVVPLVRSATMPPEALPNPLPDEPTSPKPQTSRFSFFSRSKSSNSDTVSVNSANSGNSNPHLTHEALERAEAETTLAALDEREKMLSAEIAKGSNGGFTELPQRPGRRSRSKNSGKSGSGSTVWSAGMSTHRETNSEDEALL